MKTSKQRLGEKGEQLVCKFCRCPRCKRQKTLRRLPTNFRCADVICDFCGYLAQVKTASVADRDVLPKTVLGAAWSPQDERMKAGIYFPLFLVLVDPSKRSSVFYWPADLQDPSAFEARNPLKANARRAGWRGFIYNLENAQGIVRLR